MMNPPLPTPTPPKPPAPSTGNSAQPAVGQGQPQNQSASDRKPAGLVEAGDSPVLVASPNPVPKIAANGGAQPGGSTNNLGNQPNQSNQPNSFPKQNQSKPTMAATTPGPSTSTIPTNSNQQSSKMNGPKPPAMPQKPGMMPPKPGSVPPSQPAMPPKPGGEPPRPNMPTNPAMPPKPPNMPQPGTVGNGSLTMPPKPAMATNPVMPPKPGGVPPAGNNPALQPKPGMPPVGSISMPPKPPGVPQKPGMMPPKPGSVPPSQPAMPPRPAMTSPQPVGLPPRGNGQTVPTPPISNQPVQPPQPPRPPGPPVPPPAAGSPPVPPMAGAATPPTPTPVAAVPKTRFAGIRQSPFKLLPLLLGLVAIIGLIAFVAMRFLGGSARQPAGTSTTPSTGSGTGNRTVVPAQQTTLVYWGLWEPSEVLTEVFDEFEAANPGIQVEYTKQSHMDYRERLQTGIASGKGPDLFRFHASWTPMLKNELAAVPTSVISAADYQKNFYPVAYRQLQVNGQLVGVPLMYDGLALYYNKEILRNANAQPPQTWADLRTLASQLTIRSGETVQRGGLAIGNANNVEHFSDIIALLMLQNGANLTQPTSAEARDALLFYTNFAKVDKVWSDNLPNSTTAFARGDVAMMFAPSWRAHEVKAQNPSLDFGIAPLPKLGDNNVTWATYWAEGVNTQSKNKDAAWKLVQYMSSASVMKKMYSDQSEIRAFGEPYSRVELANDLASQPLVAPYLADAPTAQGWYLSSFTHDNGINDQLIKYYQDAVNAILTGKKIEDVLVTLNQGTAQVLRQYGITVTANPAGGTP